jgi:hypothetical protein
VVPNGKGAYLKAERSPLEIRLVRPLLKLVRVPSVERPETVIGRAVLALFARRGSGGDGPPPPAGYRLTFSAPRAEEVREMSPVSVRYIADDVESVTEFYRDNLGFTVELSPAPGFAVLSRGELRLLLNAPGSGGAGEVEALRKTGARFRNEIVTGRGGKQILLEDPSGNPIELFQPG